MEIRKDYSLLPHNTFGMDVKASLFIEYASVEELKDISLLFRGSSNQRLINMKKTLAEGRVVIWEN